MERTKNRTYEKGDAKMADMQQKKISIGVEDFAEIINKDGYFVDKTLMIQNLIESNAKVTLFTPL